MALIYNLETHRPNATMYEATPEAAQEGSERTSLREARKNLGMTLTQGAKALEISSSLLEKWENEGRCLVDHPSMLTKYHEFLAKAKLTDGLNLIFGTYPLKIARELLEVDVEEIADIYGFAPNTWRKFESNARILDVKTLRNIEAKIKEQLSYVCGEFE